VQKRKNLRKGETVKVEKNWETKKEEGRERKKKGKRNKKRWKSGKKREENLV
jgi:hypothetical protein